MALVDPKSFDCRSSRDALRVIVVLAFRVGANRSLSAIRQPAIVLAGGAPASPR